MATNDAILQAITSLTREIQAQRALLLNLMMATRKEKKPKDARMARRNGLLNQLAGALGIGISMRCARKIEDIWAGRKPPPAGTEYLVSQLRKDFKPAGDMTIWRAIRDR